MEVMHKHLQLLNYKDIVEQKLKKDYHDLKIKTMEFFRGLVFVPLTLTPGYRYIALFLF